MRALANPALVALLLLGAALGCARDEAKRRAPTSVAMASLAYVDETRESYLGSGPRPLAVTVWYPAATRAPAAMRAGPADNPVFLGGEVQVDAPPAEGRRPIVLISHAEGGSAFQMMWLGRRLAEAGFIAAAVDHHGATTAEPAFDPRGFMMPWERARDLSAVLDRLLADARFAPLIDAERSAAAGFSAGGLAALLLAGARADPGMFAAFCASAERDATCDPQKEYPNAAADFATLLRSDPVLATGQARARDSYRDGRIKAVAALAPAPAQLLTAESLFTVAAPVLLIAGEKDGIAPARTNAARIESLAPRARLEILPKAGHYVFLNACSKEGRRRLPACRDAEGVQREEVHDRAAADIIAFLQKSFGEGS